MRLGGPAAAALPLAALLIAAPAPSGFDGTWDLT